MSIVYSYKIENVNAPAKAMEIVYTSEGRETQRIGARMPYEGESLEAVVRMFSPVNLWIEQELSVQAVEEGSTGVIDTTQPYAAPVSVAADLVPEPTFEEAKELKLAEIAQWRYAVEAGGITVSGLKIQTDRSSRFSMQELAAGAKAANAESVSLKIADGSFASVSMTELDNILSAVFAHVQAVFSQEAVYVAQVASAQDKAALDAIVLP